jgi:hypothetical protein
MISILEVYLFDIALKIRCPATTCLWPFAEHVAE